MESTKDTPITESSYLSSVAPLLVIRIDREDVGDGCGRGQSGGWCGSESPTKRLGYVSGGITDVDQRPEARRVREGRERQTRVKTKMGDEIDLPDDG